MKTLGYRKRRTRERGTERRFFSPPLAKAFLTAALLLTTAACDDTAIDPFVNEDRFFTIYGFIDVLDPQHTVRVIPITRTPEKIENPATASIDAEVFSTNLNTGVRREWNHSLERLSNDLYAHIFSTTFPVQPRHTYRIEVRRSDGARTWAQTTVPLFTDPALFDLAPYAVSPDSSEITQEVVIRGVPSPGDLLVNYRFTALTPDLVFGEDNDIVRSSVEIPYGRTGDPTDDGWRFTLNLSADQAAVREHITAFLRGGQSIGTVTLNSIGIQMKVLDENWVLPAGEVNVDTLAQPGAFSNVQNGFGFWGSIGLYIQEWAVPPDLSLLLDD